MSPDSAVGFAPADWFLAILTAVFLAVAGAPHAVAPRTRSLIGTGCNESSKADVTMPPTIGRRCDASRFMFRFQYLDIVRAMMARDA